MLCPENAKFWSSLYKIFDHEQPLHSSLKFYTCKRKTFFAKKKKQVVRIYYKLTDLKVWTFLKITSPWNPPIRLVVLLERLSLALKMVFVLFTRTTGTVKQRFGKKGTDASENDTRMTVIKTARWKNDYIASILLHETTIFLVATRCRHLTIVENVSLPRQNWESFSKFFKSQP